MQEKENKRLHFNMRKMLTRTDYFNVSAITYIWSAIHVPPRRFCVPCVATLKCIDSNENALEDEGACP